MMERKTRYEVQELFRVWHGWKYRIYNWEQLEIWYRDKIKGTVKPEKLEFNEGTSADL